MRALSAQEDFTRIKLKAPNGASQSREREIRGICSDRPVGCGFPLQPALSVAGLLQSCMPFSRFVESMLDACGPLLGCPACSFHDQGQSGLGEL